MKGKSTRAFFQNKYDMLGILCFVEKADNSVKKQLIYISSTNKELLRVQHDMTTICQKGKVEQVYIKSKCVHSISTQ